ncbi:MAG: hypothetical protein U0796_23490 [Gemmatales bacterium]
MSKAASKSGRGEKAQAIRDALKNHPHLKNREIAELLSNKGIKCSSQDIANQKARLKRLSGDGIKSTFTLEDLRKVKAIVADSGGYKTVLNKLADIDKLAEQVGGLDKLRKGLEVLPEFNS